jgi:periplasmic divalent cation tolerance protein
MRRTRRSYDQPVAPPVVQVSTTAPDEDTARRIADSLLTDRLAACVQVLGPMTSRYWWDGAIEQSTEWLCVAKTTADAAGRATDAIRAAHPYDVPEVLVSPVTGGSAPYLDWVAAEVR